MSVAVTYPAVQDALIPLSALQHHLFCPRQCALNHVEGSYAAHRVVAVSIRAPLGGRPSTCPSARMALMFRSAPP